MKNPDDQKNNSLRLTAWVVLTLAVVVFFIHLISSRIDPRGGGLTEKYLNFLSVKEESSSQASSLPQPESLSGASQMALGQKIDLNKATAKDLEALPAIGPKMAETIIQDRDHNGPFRSLNDLKRVKGIKDKKFSEIKDFVRVGPSIPSKS